MSPPPPRSTASDRSDTATATSDWSVRSKPAGRPTARKPRTVPRAPSGCSTTRSRSDVEGRRAEQATRPQDTDLVAQGGLVIGRTRGRRGHDPTGRVEHEDPGAQPSSQAGRHRRDRLGAERGAREVALGLEGAGRGLVVLGRDHRGDGLGDRDERRGLGHLDHDQPLRRRRPEERLGNHGVGETDAKAVRRDPGFDQALDIGRPGRTVVRTQPHPRGQQQLAALQEAAGVLQLAHRDPAHDPVLALRGAHRATAHDQSEAGQLDHAAHARRGLGRHRRSPSSRRLYVRANRSGRLGPADRAPRLAHPRTLLA